MFPDFQYFLQWLLGRDIPTGFSLIKTFGVMVAIAFAIGAYFLKKELKRREQNGLIPSKEYKVIVGEPLTTTALLSTIILGFIIGCKFIGLIADVESATFDPMNYLLSLNGSLGGGIVGAILFGGYQYWEGKKNALPQPKTVVQKVFPSDKVFEFIIMAAISGFAGAKIFNAMETWDHFISDPIGNLFSSSGLTFYGGLICATIASYFWAKKNQISFGELCDAAAPSLMLAYAVGRLGCQLSGDGDWGIPNAAYISDADGSLLKVSMAQFNAVTAQYANYFEAQFNSATAFPHVYAAAPSWLPDWLFAQNYTHNVINEGVRLADCTGHYCNFLPTGVFPTPLYEFIAGTILFMILWQLRHRLQKTGQIFGLYLIFNGLERFLVEKIRVNYKYDWGFIHPTQAEIISVIMALIGAYLLFINSRKKQKA